MSDQCARFRRSLTRGGHSGDHARSCPECGSFVRDWASFERALAAEARVTPPPGFASRVRSRLPQAPHPVVAMSLKVLPATLTLLAAAGLWIAIIVPTDAGEQLGSTDDYLEWLVDDTLADAALLGGGAR